MLAGVVGQPYGQSQSISFAGRMNDLDQSPIVAGTRSGPAMQQTFPPETLWNRQKSAIGDVLFGSPDNGRPHIVNGLAWPTKLRSGEAQAAIHLSRLH